MFEQLNGYKSIFLDYSVLLEYADNPVFDEFLQVVDTGIDLYVDKSFKALHYCVLHIKDPKDRAAAAAMKKICSVLLSQNRLHLIRELEIDKVALNINEIADFLQVDPKELTGDTDIDLAVKKQDPKEDKLLSLFRSVTDSEKELLIKVVDTFVLGLRKARQQTN